MNDRIGMHRASPVGRLICTAATAAAALALVAGCSGNDGGGGAGAKCTSSADCQQNFVCRNQQCIQQQANNNGGGGTDAGPNTDGGGNNGNSVEPENFYISYRMLDKSDNSQSLHVLSTADNTDTRISPESVSCAQGCWLSEDMSYFVWVENSASGGSGTLDVHAAPVSNLQVQGTGSVVAQGVSRVSVAGNLVTYQRATSGGQYTAYYKSLAGGDEKPIGALGTAASVLSGWFIDPATQTVMVYTPNIQTLDIKMGTLGTPVSDTTYTVDARNYQQTSGSYFGQTMPVAISPDGKVAAFVTQAPNDYGACQSAADCSGPVKRCGQNNRCTAIETTVHFIDMEHLGDLGGACGGPGTCGSIHECYQPGSDATSARCIPGRVVLGIPDQPYQSPGPGQPAKSGCELTTGNANYHYTTFAGPISFDSNDMLYGVGRRDCPNENTVGDSDVLQIDPNTGNYNVVWGNPDAGFNADACWDADAQKPSDAECVPYIQSALLSPGGNEIAMLATNPWIEDPNLATQIPDVWTVLRNGQDHAWVGQHDQLKVVESIAVHPAP